MTYFNRLKEAEIEIAFPSTAFSGEVRIEKFKGVEFPKGSGQVFEFAGTRKIVMDWVDNIILDQGLDHYYFRADLDWGASDTDTMYRCTLGTDNTAENALQTGCIAPVATKQYELVGTSYGARSTPPYYGWHEKKYRFIPGFGGGNININEMSFGFNASGGFPTLSEHNALSTARVLTKDGNGDPTSISVLADEYLDVYYRRRQYPGYLNADGTPNDGTGSFQISGVTYNYTIRPSRVTNNNWGEDMHRCLTGISGYGWVGGGRAYGPDVVFGSVTFEPAATEGSTMPTASSASNWGTYTPGSYQQTATVTIGLDSLNFTNPSVGIGSCYLWSSMGAYQMIFDNPIPKDNTKILTWSQTFSWARKTI